MAVTRIWRIRGDAGAPIQYVENPEKTKNDFSEEDRQALADVITYAANEKKTEKRYFTTGINCSVYTARDQFENTKISFNKQGGIVALHAYQSFEEGETTPEEAHAIGVELAKELWGDRFQVVVATHLNTAHLHNHFIINSVSFRDGKRFHMCTDRYTELKHASDRICREHGLSVIEKPKGRRTPMKLYKMEQAGMPTRYNVAREAIDEAIRTSLNLREFQAVLRKMGYQCRLDPNHKYWTVTPPGWTKPIRTARLGDDYTRAQIEARIYEGAERVRMERFQSRSYPRQSYHLRRRIDRIMGRSGLQKLYLRYCYELGYLPKHYQKPSHVHELLKDDLLKCEQYSEEARFLSKNKIVTDQDLAAWNERADTAVLALTEKREELRRTAKRKLPEEEKVTIKEQIADCTGRLRELRHEKKLAEDIEARSAVMEEKIQTIDKQRGKEMRQR